MIRFKKRILEMGTNCSGRCTHSTYLTFIELKKIPSVGLLVLLPFLLFRTEAADSVDELFSAEGVLETIQAPERVSACALKSINPPKKYLLWGQRDWSKRKYEEKEYVTVPESSLRRMRKDWFAEDSYRWDSKVGCRPIFQSRVRFEKGEQVVEIDFCFGCSIMLVRNDGKVVSSALLEVKDTVFLDEMIALFPDESMFN